jgi:hypothetical protein
MLQVLQVLSHPFCMQNKQAYTPEVVHRIIWAIIVDTQSFFDDIKLAEDFLEQGHYMQFLASTCPSNMESNFNGTTSHKSGLCRTSNPGLSTNRERGGGYHIPPGVPSGPQAHGPSLCYRPHQRLHNTTGGLRVLSTNATQR